MPPPIDLSDDDLARAAIAARVVASKHEEHSAGASGGLREHFLEQSRRYRALADRLERHRTPGNGT